jgi:nucleoside-triphosphatase THEP1
MTKAKILVITGEIESGKTSLCQEIITLANELGINSTGLISPGFFEGDEKIAIDAEDLSSGERRRLAVLKTAESSEVSTKRWSFDPETVCWGNQVLSASTPCDLLIVDELGPLEFNQAKGWISAFEVIENKDYQAAILVIRPSLVQQASRRWEINQILDLSGSGPFPYSIKELLDNLLNTD